VRTARARIIDPLGRVLAATDDHDPLVVRDIDLDYIVCHTDYHQIEEDLVARHGDRVQVDTDPDACRMMITSAADDLELSDLVTEFGLTPWRVYVDAHRKQYPTLRAGFTPPAQRLPFAGRPPWTRIDFEQWRKQREQLDV